MGKANDPMQRFSEKLQSYSNCACWFVSQNLNFVLHMTVIQVNTKRKVQHQQLFDYVNVYKRPASPVYGQSNFGNEQLTFKLN